mgnify:FL=1
MNVSAIVTQDHNWWHTTKSQVDLDAACKVEPENDDAEPYACDDCGSKVLELYPVNGTVLSGVPLKSYDYVCKECVSK